METQDRWIQPRPVILQLHLDDPATLSRGKAKRAGYGFVERRPLARASMPWSTALRSMWISGSRSCSRILRSISIVLPFNHELDLFAGGVRNVANHALEAAE